VLGNIDDLRIRNRGATHVRNGKRLVSRCKADRDPTMYDVQDADEMAGVRQQVAALHEFSDVDDVAIGIGPISNALQDSVGNLLVGHPPGRTPKDRGRTRVHFFHEGLFLR
jgi:hypothetical protein